jgi:hypothetical protein
MYRQPSSWIGEPYLTPFHSCLPAASPVELIGGWFTLTEKLQNKFRFREYETAYWKRFEMPFGPG